MTESPFLRRSSTASNISNISSHISVKSESPRPGLYSSSILHDTNYNSDESGDDSDLEGEDDFEKEMGSIEIARMINLGDGTDSKGLAIIYKLQVKETTNSTPSTITRLTSFNSDLSTYSENVFSIISDNASGTGQQYHNSPSSRSSSISSTASLGSTTSTACSFKFINTLGTKASSATPSLATKVSNPKMSIIHLPPHSSEGESIQLFPELCAIENTHSPISKEGKDQKEEKLVDRIKRMKLSTKLGWRVKKMKA